MKHHFLESPRTIGDLIKISGEKFHHLKNVLRLRIGEKINFFDKDFEYLTEIEAVDSQEITAKILEKSAIIPPEKKVYLAQGLAKAGKIDLVLQKISEIGVDGLIPFVSRNSEVKLAEEKVAAKLAHWQKIAVSAAEQSGRSSILEISTPVEWAGLLKKFSEFDLILIFWEKATPRLREILAKINLREKRKILLVVGPEGSFTDEEISEAQKNKNVELVTLGENILRTETAGIVAAALVMFELGRIG